ncbi:MAG: hypothetical protein K6G83_14045 [Lachnospiraceae bacterium]|nr:hypothetical protein [Lachnospiraceae bacterium]
MCSGNVTSNPVQEQKTDSEQKNVINTHLDEKETALTRSGPEQPPVVEKETAKEADRLERIKQIKIQPVPELKIPERTLFDEYRTAYEVDAQQVKIVEIEKQEYADRYKEKNISENKRAGKAKNPKSRLYRKAENARRIEDAKEREQEREIRLLRNASKDLSISLKEEDTLMLTKLMSGDAEHDKELLTRYAGDKTAKEEVMLQLLEEFMHMDLTLYDLSNEEAIAGNAKGFEALSARVEAMFMLEEKNPAFFKALPSDVKDSFKIQKENAIMVVSYYRLTKMIVTDPYYRTHYNSEISRQWNPEDPPAKQRLTRLLWMRTSVASHRFRGKSWKSRPDEIAMDDIGPVKKKHEKYKDIYCGVVSSDGEFAKSSKYHDETNPHFDFFRQLEKKDPELDRKIKMQIPALAGTGIKMDEKLVRTSTRAMEGMRGIRNLTQEHLVQMLNDIYAVPKEGATPEEIEAVRQQNLAGLRQYKLIVAEQIAYIDRKYPFLHEFATADEVEKHMFEIQDDLCGIQILIGFMKMIQKIPELYDPEDPNDRWMYHTADSFMYLQGPERFAGTAFDMRGHGAAQTMVGMRMGHSIHAMTFGLDNANYAMISLLDKLEKGALEVRWDEEIIYEPLAVAEPESVSKTLEKMERRFVRENRSKEASKAAGTLKDQDFSTGTGTPKTSDLMKHVKSQYFEIDRRMQEPIPDDGTLFKNAVDEIEDSYFELIRACTLYEEKRNPRTDLGKQRKEMVRTIRENAVRERDIFHVHAGEYFESAKGGTFGDVIGDFQRTEALQALQK